MIIDHPNNTIDCDECGGQAHKVVEDFGDFQQEGWECNDCGHLMAP